MFPVNLISAYFALGGWGIQYVYWIQFINDTAQVNYVLFDFMLASPTSEESVESPAILGSVHF
jgi:hypothetical protein